MEQPQRRAPVTLGRGGLRCIPRAGASARRPRQAALPLEYWRAGAATEPERHLVHRGLALGGQIGPLPPPDLRRSKPLSGEPLRALCATALIVRRSFALHCITERPVRGIGPMANMTAIGFASRAIWTRRLCL